MAQLNNQEQGEVLFTGQMVEGSKKALNRFKNAYFTMMTKSGI